MSNFLALKSTDDDKLNFSDRARGIAYFINRFNEDTPYSISINGTWGSGKSTMLNFIEEYLDERKCKVIRFNPWMVSNKEDLIRYLFEEIYYQIDGGFTNTKEKFKSYSKKIIPTVTSSLAYLASISQGLDPQMASVYSQGSSTIVNNIQGDFFDKPLSHRKKELDKEMKMMFAENNIKLVVMIDELDRLFPDEIVTVFQMIKSCLDFPGIFFVIAMDEVVVTEALEEKGIRRPNYYLQKIFQRKYTISDSFQLRTLCENFLKPKLPIEDETNIFLINTLNSYFYLNPNSMHTTHYVSIDSYDGTIEDAKKWTLILPQEPIFYKDSNDVIEAVEIVAGGRGESVHNSYNSIFKMIRDDYHLQNPRNFLAFAQYTIDNWKSYSDNLFKIHKMNQVTINIAFLLFLANFIEHQNSQLLNFRDSSLRGELPTIKAIYDHIVTLIPEFKEFMVEDKKRYRSNRPLNIINDALAIMHFYPDMINKHQWS